MIYQCALHDVPVTVSHMSITGAKEEDQKCWTLAFSFKSDAAEIKSGGFCVYIYLQAFESP